MRYLDRGVKALSAQSGRQPAETERRWGAALHRNLAWAQWGRGLHQQALADSDAALALMPQSAAVHCIRALIFKELKQCQNEQQAWLGCVQYMNRPADATERQWSAQAQERLLASCSALAPP